MLSIANVRSPSAAATYFAADNYYAKADADRSGQWVGKAAETLGLTGQVGTKAFDSLLSGELPGGIQVGNPNQPHRPGTDLTFSMPKSWSLLALVGGDKRIITAYREAVIATLVWAEKNAAETRIVEKGQIKTVPTGNLAIGLFQHDTNRNQEPNLHFHAVIANVTQGPNGKWLTLKNDRLWSLNTLLNSMTMARFRIAVEKLGYQPGATGKHGNFEAEGFTRADIMAFSSRRQEIIDAVRQLGIQTPKARDIAALQTRSAKAPIADRDALASSWRGAADDIGMDLQGKISSALSRTEMLNAVPSFAKSLTERGKKLLRDFAARIRGNADDPLIPDHIFKQDAESIAAAQSVASAVRHLGEREAAFPREALLKTALDFGLPTTIDHLEQRVRSLVRSGALVKGAGGKKDWLTSQDAITLEEQILVQVESGRSAVSPVISSDVAAQRVQAVSALNHGFTLNEGQEAGARLILSSTNRTLAVQGVAGAGKSSLLKPVSELLREEGKQVLGLAVQNTLVQMLERDTGISSMTLARFLGKHTKLLDAPTDRALLSEARQQLKDQVLVLDEASMVSSADKEKLVRLANLARVDRLVLIGDRKQLGAVDAGKPFDLIQQAGTECAVMDVNLRARDIGLRRAQSAAQAGQVARAMGYLNDHTIETNGDSAVLAAEHWLSLSPSARENTAIYASGRALRSTVNQAVQTGLKANGELGEEPLRLSTLTRVNTTREELRYVSGYKAGMVLEVTGRDRSQGLRQGQYRVAAVDAQRKIIKLRDARGKMVQFRPSKMRAGKSEDRLALFEEKQLDIHSGERIRWTKNDHKRGLFNADQAKIADIDKTHVTLVTSAGLEHKLKRSDPCPSSDNLRLMGV